MSNFIFEAMTGGIGFMFAGERNLTMLQSKSTLVKSKRKTKIHVPAPMVYLLPFSKLPKPPKNLTSRSPLGSVRNLVNYAVMDYSETKAAEVEAQQPMYLEMSFNAEEVAKGIHQYIVDNDVQDPESDIPPHVVYGLYEGDLIIALKEVLINPHKQAWFFGADVYYYNLKTDSLKTVSVQFDTPEMSWGQFRHGAEEIKVNRGKYLEPTPWLGINDELDRVLERDKPKNKDYIRVRVQIKVATTAKFISGKHLMEFKFLKKVRDESGAEGVKNIQEKIDKAIQELKAAGVKEINGQAL